MFEPLLMDNESITPNEMPRNDDHAYLYKVTPEQDFVERVLKDMCMTLHEKSVKMFEEYLNDGRVFEAKSCPTNTISLERQMTKSDKSTVMAPNANICTSESKIMYKENKPRQWINEQVWEKYNNNKICCK